MFIGPHEPRGFLNLPAELRLQVYDLVYEPCFQPEQQFIPFFCTENLKYCPRRGRTTPLHQVNRQLRSECLPFYLERTTFVFDLSVLDPDTAKPTLVSWAKATEKFASLERNIIINMRVGRKSSPMFTIFISNTKSGQRLDFKENDFRPECDIWARGMRDAKDLRLHSFLNCRHTRCLRYVCMINDLKQTLRWLALEIPSLRRGLSVNDVVEIAKASKLLQLLSLPPRWSRSTSEWTITRDTNAQETSAQETIAQEDPASKTFIPQSQNVSSLEKTSKEVKKHREISQKIYGWLKMVYRYKVTQPWRGAPTSEHPIHNDQGDP